MRFTETNTHLDKREIDKLHNFCTALAGKLNKVIDKKLNNTFNSVINKGNCVSRLQIG